MRRTRHYRLPVFRLFPRPMRPDELPPEKGVILVRGGRP